MLKVRAGDLVKMGLLFERYHRELFGYMYHMCRRADVSEDIVQTVFYRMLKYRHTFTGEGSFRSWMYHLARNVLVDTSQKNKWMYYHQDVADYAEKLDGGVAADELLEKEQERALLHEALNGLSAENREVLVLSRFQELKYEEIAHILEITEGAVKVRVHRAMNELRKIYLRIEQ